MRPKLGKLWTFSGKSRKKANGGISFIFSAADREAKAEESPDRMKNPNEYRDGKVIRGLLRKIEAERHASDTPCRIMEVCGTHTMTIHRYGLQPMLEAVGVNMVSGPGCPVCITPAEIHEAAIKLVSETENLVLATFGDMTRVPTRLGSLQSAVPGQGSSVKIIYSPEESLTLAREKTDKQVVFFGVGFETTIPSIALVAKTAAREALSNYSVLSALWLIPPPLRAILESGEVRISGFLYPGHVSAIIGERAYDFIAKEFGLAGVIAGFEPGDILLAVSSILDQIAAKRPGVMNEYKRVVRPEGNPLALALMKEILEPKDACWRGLGVIPGSGLRLKKEYEAYDTEKKFGLTISPRAADLPGCRCGQVLRGILSPPECPLFGKTCAPESPFGPCMVSFEGACLIHFRYGRKKRGPGRSRT
jgi:hydrogenase expression/formation protein HypD